MANIEDVDFDEPAPMKRPGKATAAAPDATKTAAKASQAAAPATVEAENMLSIVGDIAPIDVLNDEEKRAALYIAIGKEISTQTPDLSTQAGRDRVKSFVFKITRTRTAVAAAGKKSTEDKRAEINATNKLISDAEAAFKLLEAEARKPLTEWEAAEEKKATERREILADIARAISWAARENPPMGADEARELIGMVEEIAVDPDLWAGDAQMIVDRKAEAVRLLRLTVDAAEIRAENARLRQQAETKAVVEMTDAIDPPSEERVIDAAERAGVPIDRVGGNAPPAAGSAAKELTPIQKARRLALPALAGLGIEGDQAKDLILAIEAGEIPGITATYKD